MTTSEMIASDYEGSRAYLEQFRTWREANILGPVIEVSDVPVSGHCSHILKDLETWMTAGRMPRGVRCASNGQTTGFYLPPGQTDFNPHIPALWEAIMAWCGERNYGARLQWHPVHLPVTVRHEVDARDVSPGDVTRLLKLTHIIRLQVPAELLRSADSG